MKFPIYSAELEWFLYFTFILEPYFAEFTSTFGQARKMSYSRSFSANYSCYYLPWFEISCHPIKAVDIWFHGLAFWPYFHYADRLQCSMEFVVTCTAFLYGQPKKNSWHIVVVMVEGKNFTDREKVGILWLFRELQLFPESRGISSLAYCILPN